MGETINRENSATYMRDPSNTGQLIDVYQGKSTIASRSLDEKALKGIV